MRQYIGRHGQPVEPVIVHLGNDQHKDKASQGDSTLALHKIGAVIIQVIIQLGRIGTGAVDHYQSENGEDNNDHHQAQIVKAAFPFLFWNRSCLISLLLIPILIRCTGRLRPAALLHSLTLSLAGLSLHPLGLRGTSALTPSFILLIPAVPGSPLHCTTAGPCLSLFTASWSLRRPDVSHRGCIIPRRHSGRRCSRHSSRPRCPALISSHSFLPPTEPSRIP